MLFSVLCAQICWQNHKVLFCSPKPCAFQNNNFLLSESFLKVDSINKTFKIVLYCKLEALIISFIQLKLSQTLVIFQ